MRALQTLAALVAAETLLRRSFIDYEVLELRDECEYKNDKRRFYDAD